MIRRSLQIVLLALSCGGAALALLANAAEPDAGAQPATQSAQPAPVEPAQKAKEAAAPDASAPPAEPPAAAPPKLQDLLQPVDDVSAAIETEEKKLEDAPRAQKELAALRSAIEKLQFKAKAAAEALQPRLEEVHAQIKKLGKPPAKSAPPETPEVAAERDRLNALAAQIDGAIKKASLVEERADQLVARVQHMRKGIFTRFLLWQTETPLQPDVWKTAAAQLHLAGTQIASILDNWWTLVALSWLALLGVIAAAALVYAGLHVLLNRLVRARTDPTAAAPSLDDRAGHALWSAAAFALPAATAALVLYAGLDEAGFLYWQVASFAESALFSFLVFVGISSLARAVLRPADARWRVVDLADASAATICLAVQAIAGVYALDYLAHRLVTILSLPFADSIVAAFVASIFYAALVAAIVRTPLAPRAHAPGAPLSHWRRYWLKALLVGLAALVLGASVLGFVALTRFIAGQLLLTGGGLVIVVLVHLAIGGVRTPVPEGAEETELEGHPTLEELRQQRWMRGLRLALNMVLFAVAVPLMLMTWGISGAEILSWARAAVFGFEIGGMHISLIRILLALGLFAALLAATRLFQRWLAARALPRTRLDTGVANSIYTGAGYVGVSIALLVAIAYAGFDITSLAIVAGALSVGIGFGLQSIVNNFVSGLVLLVERPVKVGDWIAIKDGEGYVRRISVRATEIETFDRASLVVPNSELITQTVTNLTHRNQIGRLNISVRVSYASDPKVAFDVLQETAENNTSILRHPAPLIVLDNLGEQAMEFTVRAYLADINRSLRVQTELRIQIVQALRAAGVDIPYFAVQMGHASGPRAAPERVSVRINTSIKADPEAVLEALRAAGRDCAGALQDPAPEAAFDNVGDGALEFSISVAIAEDAAARHIETALRVAAVKALRRRGIALAGPQQAAEPGGADPQRAQLYGADNDSSAQGE